MALFATPSDSGAQLSVPRLPDPSGSFAIGRVSYDWTDQSRPEALSDVPQAHRELMVYVWYPAAPENPGSPHAPYLPGAVIMDKSPNAKGIKDLWEGTYVAFSRFREN
jgi:hypothetical protein